MHRPIAQPVASLLLTLINNAEYRDTYGAVLVDALRRLFVESEDWEWIRGVLGHVVGGVEEVSKGWVRSGLGETLEGLRRRVEGDVEREWGMVEAIDGFLKDEA